MIYITTSRLLRILYSDWLSYSLSRPVVAKGYESNDRPQVAKGYESNDRPPVAKGYESNDRPPAAKGVDFQIPNNREK